MRRSIFALPLAALTVLAMTGCGGGRSVDAYCETFYGEGAELRERWLAVDGNGDPFAALGTMLSAPRDLAAFFGQLAEVAPNEIRADVETTRDVFQRQADGLGETAGDLASGPAAALGALGGGLASALAAGPAMQRVDTWTTENCGPPPSS